MKEIFILFFPFSRKSHILVNLLLESHKRDRTRSHVNSLTLHLYQLRDVTGSDFTAWQVSANGFADIRQDCAAVVWDMPVFGVAVDVEAILSNHRL